jgi:hypothetical protein
MVHPYNGEKSKVTNPTDSSHTSPGSSVSKEEFRQGSITSPILPPDNIKKLYRIRKGTTGLVVHEVPPSQDSLVEGDVYVLDKGVNILQLNTKKSVGKRDSKLQSLCRES